MFQNLQGILYYQHLHLAFQPNIEQHSSLQTAMNHENSNSAIISVLKVTLCRASLNLKLFTQLLIVIQQLQTSSIEQPATSIETIIITENCEVYIIRKLYTFQMAD